MIALPPEYAAAGTLKALSIRQPWAWLILSGHKTVENRNWATRFKGPVLIHAAKGMTRGEYEAAALFALQRGVQVPAFHNLERGGLVGVAEIVGCVSASVSPWFQGPFGFVLGAVRRLPFVPCAGALGFFDVSAGR